MLNLQNDQSTVPQIIHLAGCDMDLAGLEGRGLMLAAFRAVVENLELHAKVAVVALDGGFALRALVGRTPYWLVAERAQALRVFRRAETAFAVCRDMGLRQVTVELAAPQPVRLPAMS